MLLVGAMLLVLFSLPSPVIDPVMTRLAGAQLGGCMDVEGLDVDVGAWPAVARSLLGGFRGVTVRAERVSLVGVTARDVTARFDRVSALRVGGIDPVEVHGGTVRATLTEADLATALAVPLLGLRVLPSGVALDAPLVPQVVLDVIADAGDLVLRPRLAGVSLVTARIAVPAPVRLREVRLGTGRLELSATMDGNIDLGRFGC